MPKPAYPWLSRLAKYAKLSLDDVALFQESFMTLMKAVPAFDYLTLRDIMDDEIYEYTCSNLEQA
jgi:hypothetical protein